MSPGRASLYVIIRCIAWKRRENSPIHKRRFTSDHSLALKQKIARHSHIHDQLLLAMNSHNTVLSLRACYSHPSIFFVGDRTSRRTLLEPSRDTYPQADLFERLRKSRFGRRRDARANGLLVARLSGTTVDTIAEFPPG